MKILVSTFILASLATVVQAAEPKIVETPDGITVEYTGLPSDKNSSGAKPATVVDDAKTARVKSLTTQIEQLKKEYAEIAARSGNETKDELTLKSALAEDKKLQIEAYTAEISQLTGNDQKSEASMGKPKEEQPVRYQSYREEKKSQIRELKKLRMSPSSSAVPQ